MDDHALYLDSERQLKRSQSSSSIVFPRTPKAHLLPPIEIAGFYHRNHLSPSPCLIVMAVQSPIPPRSPSSARGDGTGPGPSSPVSPSLPSSASAIRRICSSS